MKALNLDKYTESGIEEVLAYQEESIGHYVSIIVKRLRPLEVKVEYIDVAETKYMKERLINMLLTFEESEKEYNSIFKF